MYRSTHRKTTQQSTYYLKIRWKESWLVNHEWLRTLNPHSKGQMDPGKWSRYQPKENGGIQEKWKIRKKANNLPNPKEIGRIAKPKIGLEAMETIARAIQVRVGPKKCSLLPVATRLQVEKAHGNGKTDTPKHPTTGKATKENQEMVLEQVLGDPLPSGWRQQWCCQPESW